MIINNVTEVTGRKLGIDYLWLCYSWFLWTLHGVSKSLYYVLLRLCPFYIQKCDHFIS